MQGIGERTKVYLSSSKRKTLKTGVPNCVVITYNMKTGDTLNWESEIRDSKMVFVVTKTEETKGEEAV